MMANKVSLSENGIATKLPSFGVRVQRYQQQLARVALNQPALCEEDFPEAMARSEDWHLRQTVYPVLSRRADWRTGLLQVFDSWANRHYSIGVFGCFLFTCCCIDAMIGSRLYEFHSGRWDSAKAFWPYIRQVGGRDYFDIVGYRSSSLTLKPSDIVQLELPIAQTNGRAHFHWAVASDTPGHVVLFGADGLSEAIINPAFRVPATMKVWRLRKPPQQTVGQTS